jgi:predicted HTH domain antitoxin
MEVTLHIPDEVAKQLAPEGGDLSRQALEALAIEGYRKQILGLYEISQMLGLSRIEAEDFLGHNQVPLADLTVADLDREAALYEAAARRHSR